MMNFGDFKKYLRDGKRREDMVGVPRTSVAVVSEDEEMKKIAKTYLKKTLAQHDEEYHKNGYKEGDECNFRDAMRRGDGADDLEKAEKKEGEVKLGYVKFKEDEKTGKKKIIGIEEVDDTEVGDERV